jgi:hypothetical protein
VVILRRGRVAAAGPLERLLDERDAADVRELYRDVTGDDGVRTEEAQAAADGDEDDGEGDGDAAPDVHVTGVSDR